MVDRKLRQRLLKPLTNLWVPIFIHIPKTSGRYMTKIFNKKNIIMSKALHTPMKLVKEMIGDQYKDRFSFCIVRNPYERFYSACKHSGITDAQEIEALSNKGVKGETDSSIKYKEHFFTQKQFVVDYDNKTSLVNYIGRYEDLKSVIKTLRKNKIDISKEFKLKENESSNWEEILTEKTISNINKMYKEDFEFFEYTIKV